MGLGKFATIDAGVWKVVAVVAGLWKVVTVVAGLWKVVAPAGQRDRPRPGGPVALGGGAEGDGVAGEHDSTV